MAKNENKILNELRRRGKIYEDPGLLKSEALLAG